MPEKVEELLWEESILSGWPCGIFQRFVHAIVNKERTFSGSPCIFL